MIATEKALIEKPQKQNQTKRLQFYEEMMKDFSGMHESTFGFVQAWTHWFFCMRQTQTHHDFI